MRGALDAPATEQTIRGMMEGFLVIVAALATGAAVFQIVARLGILGPGMRGVVLQNWHLKEAIVVACIFWAGWYVLADM